MSEEPGVPGSGDWGDEGFPSWYARVTGVGTSVGQSLIVPALALLTALIVGGVIIALTDVDTLSVWGEDPWEAFKLTIAGIFDAYKALFVGSLGSPRAISETLFTATPLILAGLAVAVGFQAGLFNIGVNGQMHIGGMAALWVAFTFSLPLSSTSRLRFSQPSSVVRFGEVSPVCSRRAPVPTKSSPRSC